MQTDVQKMLPKFFSTAFLYQLWQFCFQHGTDVLLAFSVDFALPEQCQGKHHTLFQEPLSKSDGWKKPIRAMFQQCESNVHGCFCGPSTETSHLGNLSKLSDVGKYSFQSSSKQLAYQPLDIFKIASSWRIQLLDFWGQVGWKLSVFFVFLHKKSSEAMCAHRHTQMSFSLQAIPRHQNNSGKYIPAFACFTS